MLRDQDQEREYPKHQPGRGARDHHDPFSPDVQQEGEMEEPRRPLHQREAATTPRLPRGHASKALTIGVIAGILVSLQGVVLTLINASVYQDAGKYMNDPKGPPLNIALHIVGLFFLGLGISALIYLISGMIIGRVAVHRRWAFFGGFVGGIVSTLIGAVLKLIPSYPNAGGSGFASSPLGVGSGIAALVIGIILLSVLAGAVTLLGAWLTTRRHPYYVGYAG